MLHFFMTLQGNKPELEFQAEVFLRSLDLFGKVDYSLTICQGPTDRLTNPYIKRKAKVVTNNNPLGFEPSWYGSLGCVPVEGDVTIYTDTDILITGDLNHIVNKCRQTQSVCGVIAYSSPFERSTDWRKLFADCHVSWPAKSYQHPHHSDPCPFYVNLGFVAVPSKYIPSLNEYLPIFLAKSNKVFPGHYHRPQLAMCLAIEALGLPHLALPIWCNYPDLFNDFSEDVDKAIVIHLLRAKSLVRSWAELKDLPAYNEVGKRVHEKLKTIARMRAI